MSERLIELRAVLADVRRRWQRAAALRAWTLGASTAAAMLLVGVLAVWLVASEGLPLVLVAALVLAIAAVSVVSALVPLRRPPSDAQLARYIEERAGDLDDVLVTAIEHAEDAQDAASPIAGRLVADAAQAARSLDVDRVVSAGTIRRAAIGAAAGSVVLLAASAMFAPSVERAGQVAGAYLFPKRYAIAVTPGSVKIEEGQSLSIVARIPGLDGGLVPELTVGEGEAARSARMTPGQAPGEFTFTLSNITVSFPYYVTAGSARSKTFDVRAIRPVKVARIDLRYEYPKGLGLAPHDETDGGDIYAPAGTKVTVMVVTDKAVRQGRLKLADGTVLALAGTDRALSADLTLARDGSYRIGLEDEDGLANAGDTEYFIRLLNDRPPDVRIVRPAGDKQVSPLEEVAIEARADDDYGLASFELVFSGVSGKETVVPLTMEPKATAAAGAHTVFLEELGVEPGDFVTYYARARDVPRGRRSMEARSDIFFLEVKPFEEEFVAAQSQAMSGMQGDQTDIDELVAAQKDIIAATWKLDARARRGGDARSADDIRAVGRAQETLKIKADGVAADVARAGADPRRRRTTPSVGPGADDPMTRAMEAMGRAAGELNRLSTSGAMPYELDALDQLLKAAAEVRRRQIQRQQANGRGGNGNRQQPDLSTLFDQELRKQQRTNYETPTSSESRDDTEKTDDPLDAIRELARRQEALARQQRDLAKNRDALEAEELKRQLERLTREQNELRQQAEDLTNQMQRQASQQNPSNPQNSSSQQSPSSQSNPSNQSNPSSMRSIAEQMRNAAGDLRRQDPRQASANADRALEQLRKLEQQMQGARPDERRRALGDLQLEARQLADEERRIGTEASRTTEGEAGDDARRRLSADQQRLADRADRLADAVKQMGRAASDVDAEERQAMEQAARELERQKLGERMRQSADALRQGTPQGGQSKPEDMARAFDQIADRLGAATGARDTEAQRLSEQLGRTQELRDRLADLQRTMDSLAQAGEPKAEGNQPGGAQAGQPGPPASASQGSPDGTASKGTGAGGRGANVGDLQREAGDQMREVQRLTDQLRRDNPDLRGSSPEDWSRSVSAPGTETFKQDFARWESLKQHLLEALERTESRVSGELRARENQERLNAGGHEAVADSYRDLVDRYYQSLASRKKAPR